MFVNSFKIVKRFDSDLNLEVPIVQQPWLLGQRELIETNFVNSAVEDAINATFDYERVKFLPKIGINLCDSIIYKLNFLNPNKTYNLNTTWNGIGFTNDEFKYRKHSLTKNFVRLDFYDSDVATNQRLLNFMTLYPKFSFSDYNNNNNVTLSFTLGNSLINPNANGEGFSLYYYKDEVIPTVPKYLYMRSAFNNAKDGSTLGLMSSNNPNLGIDEIAKTTIGTNIKNKLYTRYVLTRDTNGYYYELDENYSSNVTKNNKSVIVNLYQISTI